MVPELQTATSRPLGVVLAVNDKHPPCTIMFLAAPSSDVFGAVEAAVMRGYVRDYAG